MYTSKLCIHRENGKERERERVKELPLILFEQLVNVDKFRIDSKLGD